MEERSPAIGPTDFAPGIFSVEEVDGRTRRHACAMQREVRSSLLSRSGRLAFRRPLDVRFVEG
jgi:hypothetical protein